MKRSIVRVSVYTEKGGVVKSDKNGNDAMYLNYISGDSVPGKAKVQSGTIAKNLGLESGKNYAVQFTEAEGTPEYPEQWSLLNLGEVSTVELLSGFSKDLFKTTNQSTKVEEKAFVGGGGAV